MFATFFLKKIIQIYENHIKNMLHKLFWGFFFSKQNIAVIKTFTPPTSPSYENFGDEPNLLLVYASFC